MEILTAAECETGSWSAAAGALFSGFLETFFLVTVRWFLFSPQVPMCLKTTHCTEVQNTAIFYLCFFLYLNLNWFYLTKYGVIGIMIWCQLLKLCNGKRRKYKPCFVCDWFKVNVRVFFLLFSLKLHNIRHGGTLHVFYSTVK